MSEVRNKTLWSAKKDKWKYLVSATRYCYIDCVEINSNLVPKESRNEEHWAISNSELQGQRQGEEAGVQFCLDKNAHKRLYILCLGEQNIPDTAF